LTILKATRSLVALLEPALTLSLGVIIVAFDYVTLYSIDHKELKTLPLVRDPPETDLDEHAESTEQSVLYNPKGTGKAKTQVHFYVGNKVMIGTRRCEVQSSKDFRNAST